MRKWLQIISVGILFLPVLAHAESKSSKEAPADVSHQRGLRHSSDAPQKKISIYTQARLHSYQAAQEKFGVSEQMVSQCDEICYFIGVSDRTDKKLGKEMPPVRSAGTPIYDKPDGSGEMWNACREICTYMREEKELYIKNTKK